MRAREFVFEGAVADSQIESLLTNCSEYFSRVPASQLNYAMHRGDRGYDQSTVNSFIPVSRIIRDRRPSVDTPRLVHEELNAIFTKEFGYPFRDGMMASGSYSQAQQYGPSNIIIPVNGYTLSYSTIYNDLYSNGISPEINVLVSEIEDGDDDVGTSRQLATEIMMMFRRGKYKAGAEVTFEAIRSGHEIMLYPAAGNTLHYYVFEMTYWSAAVVPKLQARLA